MVSVILFKINHIEYQFFGYVNNFIGRSQFDADPDANVALSDFRIYDSALSEGMLRQLLLKNLTQLLERSPEYVSLTESK